MDRTGFRTSRLVRWLDHQYGCTRQEHAWVKAPFATGVKTNSATGVRILDRAAADAPRFVPLRKATAEHVTVREASGDKASSWLENLAAVAALGGTPLVAFQVNASPERGGRWERRRADYLFGREEFWAH